MPVRSAAHPQSARAIPAANAVTSNPQVRSALDWLQSNVSWINDEQARITEIPAPPFHEEARAAALKSSFESLGLSASTDKTGNVIASLAGANPKSDEAVVLSAHLDTVFPADTDVRVRRDGSRMTAPGISDNGAGLSAMLGIARAIKAAHIQPEDTILFVANVGEEGEGNLRGMRALMQDWSHRIKAVIVLDGSSTEYVTTKALASRRLEAVITGPGGHSWSDFGLPNPINALVRGSVRFINTRVPNTPRTTFNLGVIEGGTSVNSIPHEASMKVDIRSESDDELVRLDTALRECIAAGVRDEMEAARDRSKGKLTWKVDLLGSRPGGELRLDSPLYISLRNADDFLGNQSRTERSSTDANIPLSMGIDAISIGAGGMGGGAHSLDEWYDATGRELGLKRVLLTVLGVSGVSPDHAQ